MHIDWWTLALQTANVLILIWLLAKFLFRPVAKIVASRQDEANKLLADAAESRRQADEARVELDHAHAGIADERNRTIAAAHAAAEAARASSLAQANEEMAKLRAEADAAISRDRIAMEKMLIDHARDLAVDIARRLLGRVSPAAGVDAFLAPLCEQVKALSPQHRAAIMQSSEGDDVEIVTAAPLGDEASERVRRAVADALTGGSPGGGPRLAFRTDPAVIAGIELNSRHAVIRNSWRNDLEHISEELNRGEESAARPATTG
jgi:F-type H+-transporting ATPase subunit b